MPGLLQTGDYARALITAWQPGDATESVEEQVSARIERQHLLERDDPPLVWMIIGEPALRNPVGSPDVARYGLLYDMLRAVASRPALRAT